MSTATIRDDITTIADAVSAGLSGVVAALTTGTQTTADIRRTAAVLTSSAAEIRVVRADLDIYDPEAEQLYEDAGVTLGLWNWERAQRWSLAGLDNAIRKGRAIATELLQGRGLTLHPVRTGDTLQSLAARYLGDWREWPRISEANGLAAGPPAVGAVLIIPARV